MKTWFVYEKCTLRTEVLAETAAEAIEAAKNDFTLFDHNVELLNQGDWYAEECAP